MPPRTAPSRRRAGEPARTSTRRRFGTLIAAISVLLPLAVSTPTQAADTTQVRPAADARPAAPTPPFAAKLTPQLIAELQRLRVPGGIVAISTPRWGTWIKALGTSDLADGRPIDVADHTRVGSITKTLTATVILQLVQERRLSLDDPIAKFRTDVPDGRNITIRQLLQMTSGLYNFSEDLDFNRVLDRAPQTQWTPDQLLRIAFRHPSYFPSGRGYHYSNTNYVLLGLVVEHLTHHPLATEIRRRVARPLGLDGTSLPDTAALPRPYAHGYEYISNVAYLTAPTLTGKAAAWADWSAGVPKDDTLDSPSWAWAAGGAVSDLHDMLRWAPALAEGTLLSPQLQRERLTWVPTSNTPGAPGYGLGIADFNGFLGHEGQIPGYNSFEAYDPTLHATLVVLLDTNQSPDGAQPASTIARLIFNQVFHLSPTP